MGLGCRGRFDIIINVICFKEEKWEPSVIVGTLSRCSETPRRFPAGFFMRNNRAY